MQASRNAVQLLAPIAPRRSIVYKLVMPFKLTRRQGAAAASPEALLNDLRNRKVAGLLAHQADILRQYQKDAFKCENVAFQMPTGSGKTFVGLLLGEWRRRSFNERIVYLCPTKQLVNQVAEQSSSKYGIKTNAFTGEKKNYNPNAKSEYQNAEAIAVTTYSGFFNGGTFFKEPDLIILDDAHAGENYVAKHWSLLIERSNQEHDSLYRIIVELIRPIIGHTSHARMLSTSEDPSDRQWVDKISGPAFLGIIEEIEGILDEGCQGKYSLQWSWRLLKGNLHACQMYLSYNSILIRPLIPPSLTHPPFRDAKQRVYMSATLGEGGDLERIFGIETIMRVPAPAGWDTQGIGRRLFFFPERSLDESAASTLIIDMIRTANRALILVPDDRTEREIRSVVVNSLNTAFLMDLEEEAGTEQESFSIFSAVELEKSKKPFVGCERAVAIVSNRYDGIDLPDDECRLIIMKGLPRALSLHERFLVTRLAARVMLNDRVLTRIVQGFGRCTRSPTDYAAIVILGEGISDCLLQPEQRSFLHPEIQAELEFGIDESKGRNHQEFLDNLRIFLEHKEDWNQADEDIVSRRNGMKQNKLPATDKLAATVMNEVRYQYAMWGGSYDKAVAECQYVLSQLSGDEVRGYRGLWNYLAGSAAFFAAANGTKSMEAVARGYFKRAAEAIPGVRWLHGLANLSPKLNEDELFDSRLGSVIEGLEEQLERLGTSHNRKFEAEVLGVINGLKSDNSIQFEDAHERLGRILGYRAYNTETTAAPDPWWVAGEDFCIVFEDHVEGKEENVLGANKVRQAASHPKWIISKQVVSQGATLISVLVTGCAYIQEDAVPYADDVRYWNKGEFLEWAIQATTAVRELRTTFPGAGSAEWRARATQKYIDKGLAPAELIKYFNASFLKNLPPKQ